MELLAAGSSVAVRNVGSAAAKNARIYTMELACVCHVQPMLITARYS